MTLEHRRTILHRYGATPQETEELLAYNETVFDHSHLGPNPTFPLPPEPHVATWVTYQAAAQNSNIFAVLRDRLTQFQFPIQAGLSQTENYRAATRKGQPTTAMPEATGLVLEQPEHLSLSLHPTPAGTIPVLIAGCRADFVSLVQALIYRNEPTPIPDSMGATMIAGYNNWDRVRTYRTEWEARQTQPISEADWQWEFKQQVVPQKALYQDRFILLSQGNYSAVPAADLGLSESEWLQLSLKIRLEHECTHYVTRRLFASMRNNLLDELIADYRGIVAATGGEYYAHWFLRFLGLEDFPHYRLGGRLENYRGDPPLSEGAFILLQALVKDAAEQLECFHRSHPVELATPEGQLQLLMLLTQLTLEELADRSLEGKLV